MAWHDQVGPGRQQTSWTFITSPSNVPVGLLDASTGALSSGCSVVSAAICWFVPRGPITATDLSYAAGIPVTVS